MSSINFHNGVFFNVYHKGGTRQAGRRWLSPPWTGRWSGSAWCLFSMSAFRTIGHWQPWLWYFRPGRADSHGSHFISHIRIFTSSNPNFSLWFQGFQCFKISNPKSMTTAERHIVSGQISKSSFLITPINLSQDFNIIILSKWDSGHKKPLDFTIPIWYNIGAVKDKVCSHSSSCGARTSEFLLDYLVYYNVCYSVSAFVSSQIQCSLVYYPKSVFPF